MAVTGVDDPLKLLRLERAEPGLFLGRCVDGAIGRVFGGHALAQSIAAASAASGSGRDIDAVHVSFVRPASPLIPMEYRTEVAKAGRAIDVIGVRTEQGGVPVMLGFVTTHEPEPSLEFGVEGPETLGPESVQRSRYHPPGTNPAVRAPFDLRYLTDPEATGVAREDVWLRTESAVRSDRQPDHAALLAYAVDFLVTRAAHAALPSTMALVGASLDHAMWLHRPLRVDDWLLVTSESSTFADSRSLSTCRVFDRAGTLVATATQEALIRPARP